MSLQHPNEKEEREKKIDLSVLETVEALARMTYKSIYVFNHKTKTFDYVSDHALFLCGYTVQEVQKMGVDFYTQCVPEDEHDLLVQVKQAGLAFFNALLPKYRKDYTLSCDFHLKHKEQPVLIRQEMTPLQLTPEGKLFKSIGILSLSTAQQAGNIVVYTKTSAHVWSYGGKKGSWEKKGKPLFTDRELSILRFSIQGFSIQEMADLLCLTSDTIKFHRKKIIAKCQVHTLTEAIRYAIVHKLL